jgi:DNA-binding beta-propeller fold protein YncE
MLVLLTGCGGGWEGFPVATRPDLTWPSPPEPPRVTWTMAIRGHEDLFTEGGGFRSITRLLTGQPDSAMVRPYALATHPAGGLLVTDPGRARVHFYCWEKRRYIALGVERQGGLPSPVGVAALADGRILVSDSRLGAVLAYDAEGRALGTFAGPESFGRPTGLAVSADGNEIYVADAANHRIVVLDPQGNVLRRLGERGSDEGRFNFPAHLAVTPGGAIAVSDAMNFRVQLIRPDGAFVRSVGSLGDAPGRFSTPKGVAADSAGRLIVVEGRYDALQFFSPESALLLNIGGPGGGPGEFWLPAGLCIDREQGLLFVADGYNSRVQVFRLLEGTPS